MLDDLFVLDAMVCRLADILIFQRHWRQLVLFVVGGFVPSPALAGTRRCVTAQRPIVVRVDLKTLPLRLRYRIK